MKGHAIHTHNTQKPIENNRWRLKTTAEKIDEHFIMETHRCTAYTQTEHDVGEMVATQERAQHTQSIPIVDPSIFDTI